MNSFSLKVVILGIIWRIYLTIAESENQSPVVTDGNRAEVGQFPWHVILKVQNFDDELESFGGSIISNKWVLTAAYPFYSPYLVKLIFGTIELDNNDTTMISSNVFIHPQFNRSTYRNDIALIELEFELDFDNNIQPIALASAAQSSNDFIGANVIITGFGLTADVLKLSDWLLWTTLEIVNSSVCDSVFDIPVLDCEMCASALKGISPCDGDSGGALVWKNENDKMVQIGLFSFSMLECSKYPTSHIKVSSYLDYIHNITGLNFD
ncbi:collagenase-like [Lucilia sericata]|uniref:collagenase-like n=1 Tax=Lucilia sericata TaxID=13632 RepID=UPI0018A80830|nr:collagenase-like [Lucilia sericata]